MRTINFFITIIFTGVLFFSCTTEEFVTDETLQDKNSSIELESGQTFYLKSNTGQYVSHNNGTKDMTADVSNPGESEEFQLINDAFGYWNLRGVSINKFVSMEEGIKDMTCNRDVAGYWERYTLTFVGTRNGNDVVGFRSIQNKSYISSENGKKDMICNRSWLREWEEFELVPTGNAPSQDLEAHIYSKTSGPDKNPLKGWNSSWWNDRDFATVGFQYIPWKNFEPSNNNFDFEAVEEIIRRPGSEGKHVVLRLYCDWAGDDFESNGGPSWLYNQAGVARLSDGKGKHITDFNDETYIKEAIEAIQALADRYDNDPRIYSFQIGVLGYWGEWHTHGYDNYNISDNASDQILTTFKNSFNDVRLMGRYPWREPLASTGGIGFHNDFFGPVGHSDEFDDAIFSDKKWLDGPIGGEMPPDWGAAEFNEMFATPRGIDMIEKGHYATMSPDDQPCDSNPNGVNCQGFMEMHRRMGYNYQIEKAVFADNISDSEALEVALEVSNIGVAPMYYNWDVEFALLKNNTVVTYLDTDQFDLRNVLPDQTFTINASKSNLSNIDQGDYQLAIRIIQPGAADTKNTSWKLDARNTYILFANIMTTIEGSWNGSNSLQGGWSILGGIAIN